MSSGLSRLSCRRADVVSSVAVCSVGSSSVPVLALSGCGSVFRLVLSSFRLPAPFARVGGRGAWVAGSVVCRARIVLGSAAVGCLLRDWWAMR